MSTLHRDEDRAAPAADSEVAVRDRYAAASQAVEPALCCPIDYDPQYLRALPQEILDRDYGCGDPSTHVREGDVVLDLGSGGGKICYIASQVVGPTGRVIGVDMTDDMLELARRYRGEVAERIGWDNVVFHKGRIQDLRIDLDVVEARLGEQPVTDANGLLELDAWKRARFAEQPMIADGSVDVVVSNCVLNLVEPDARAAMFQEIFRVLKKGGRAAISDIISDEPVPKHLRDDPHLWSGCISGAMSEGEFLAAFEAAGFHGLEITSWTDEAWQTVEGIEFRSVTVVAWKGKQGACWDCNQAVIYKGPYKSVLDDDGHTYPRGVRVAVCDKTFNVLRAGPYAEQFAFVEPIDRIAVEDAEPFPCAPVGPGAGSSPAPLRRSPRATKGESYALTSEGCGPDGCC